jgi:hypothetical protein
MTKARDIADGVDTADIADGAISTAKLADGSISTAKIADSSITNAKISGMASSKLTGDLPAISGAALTGISAGLPGPRAEVFTTSGTFTVPAGVTACKVTVVGGGGGGGNAYNNSTVAPGGSGGGTAIKWITGLTAGDTVSVTIGAGGTGGTAYPSTSPGTTGGTSSFGTYCSATGGAGGRNSGSPQQGIHLSGQHGGVGTGGDLNISGGDGARSMYGTVPAHGVGGEGGAPMAINGRDPYFEQVSTAHNDWAIYWEFLYKTAIAGPFGGRSGMGGCTISSSYLNGDDATGYGCGGGGPATIQYNSIKGIGGDGYQGIVIVEY